MTILLLKPMGSNYASYSALCLSISSASLIIKVLKYRTKLTQKYDSPYRRKKIIIFSSRVFSMFQGIPLEYLKTSFLVCSKKDMSLTDTSSDRL